MEYWSEGVMEYWSGGVLGWWSTGVVEYGVVEYWIGGVDEIKLSSRLALKVIDSKIQLDQTFTRVNQLFQIFANPLFATPYPISHHPNTPLLHYSTAPILDRSVAECL
jgi:hypothetical protein